MTLFTLSHFEQTSHLRLDSATVVKLLVVLPSLNQPSPNVLCLLELLLQQSTPLPGFLPQRCLRRKYYLGVIDMKALVLIILKNLEASRHRVQMMKALTIGTTRS